MKDLKIEEYFTTGIEMAKANYWLIFGNFLITCVLCFLAAMTIIGILIIPALLAGYYKFLLRAARGEKVEFMDSWSSGFQDGLWWKSLLLMFLSALGILVGFILLVIPGIYLATAWLLAWFLLVDRDMLPTEALGKSRELVHEMGFWKVFGVYILLTIGLQIISVIPVVNILLLFAYPFVMMVYVALYENAINNDSPLPLEGGIGE